MDTDENTIREFSMVESPHEKLIVAHLVKKFPVLYGTRKFITVFKDPTTGTYSEPDKFSPHLPILFLLF
jgi:hypothetical protein